VPGQWCAHAERRDGDPPAPDEGKTTSTVLDSERELARILGALPEHGAQARTLEVANRTNLARSRLTASMTAVEPGTSVPWRWGIGLDWLAAWARTPPSGFLGQ
jgi:hypothetical protein